MADDYKEIEESFLGARNYANELADILSTAGNNTKKANEFASQLADNLKSQTSTADQLNQLVQSRNEYIEENVKSGKFLSKGLLEQLDTQIKILEGEQKREEEVEKQKDLAKKYEDILKGQNDQLKESLGYSSELADLFAAGGVMALGAKAFTSAIEKTKDAFTGTASRATDLYKSLGVSAGEAAGLAGDMQLAASTSLLYDMEDMSSAASALSDKFGTTQHITQDLMKDVAEISSLTGDAASAADLAVIFESAGADASDLTSEIKDIASGVGVNASAVMQDMAANQRMMLGMSKEEIKVLAEKSAELAKQGLSISKMRDMSDNMLNIESSLKAEMKAIINRI